MKRRDFFKLTAHKTAELGYRLAAQGVERRARKWLRPPFAQDELEFLLLCSRCDKCIEACPHDVLFRLPAQFGAQVTATPAMDLANRGCHLCADWPCVQACEPKALALPKTEDDEAPPPVKFADVEIDTSRCLPYLGPECGACADSCPVPGALIWHDRLRPEIDQDLCTGCALCREACILDPKAVSLSAVREDGQDQPQ